MLMPSTTPPPLPPRSEQGFTLIELLVAMLSATVVIGALYAVLVFTLNQETRTNDKVQADQIGRTAMTRIVEELHSSCTGFGAASIQVPGGTPSSPMAVTGALNLWLVSAYGNSNSAEPLIEAATEHDINWTSSGKLSSTGETLGTLTDYSFKSEAGNAKAGWEFPPLMVSRATKTILSENVIPPQISSASTLFQYYKYNSSGELTQLKSSSEIKTAATANEIAKVAISFTQAPTSEDTRPGRTASFSDSVVLRFDPSESGSGAVNAPCE